MEITESTEAMMNRLMLAAVILLSGCAVASAQQSDQKPLPSVASVETENQNPSYRPALGVPTPALSVKWPQARLQDQATIGRLLVRSEPSFVWTNGALYNVMWSGLRIPVPGGGASGCFTLDLPERIAKVERFVETLTEGKQTQQHQAK
jgi:hypothetical protein